MRLDEGIAALGLMLPAGAEERLAAYLALLMKWNKTYNLTAIRDQDAMVTHHLLDSLTVLPEIQKSVLAGCNATNGVWQGFHLADIGSGAGLPGLVLAMVQPDWMITSVETVEKKAAFQRQAKIELGLANVSIHCGRAELLQNHFDAVISRAFASLREFVELAGHLANCMWAMKGDYPADEIEDLPEGWQVIACHELKVPGLDVRRHLLQLERN